MIIKMDYTVETPVYKMIAEINMVEVKSILI